jgi:hypothetical protein
MTSPRTLTAIASAAAASFTVAGAHASTLYDAGLLSFESKAQSMWDTGAAFRKAESVFVGTEWSNRNATLGGITGSANELITPKIPSVQLTPEIPGYTIPGVPRKLITPAVYSPAIPATYVNVPPVKGRVCAPWPFEDECTTVTITEGYRKQVSPYVAPKLISNAIYSPEVPPKVVAAIPAVYSPEVPAVYGDTRTGATIDVRSSGKVGMQFGYAIDSGSVDTTASFRATAQLPGTVKAAEYFSLKSGSMFEKGTIATQSPKIEAHITPILQLSGTIDAKACGVTLGCATSGPVALPTIDVKDQRLLSIDANSLKVLDGVLPGGKPLAEVPIANQTLTLEGGVTTTKPPVVGFNLNGPGGVTLITTLPPGVPTVTASLAEVTTTVPNIATAGSASAAPVTSSGRSDLLSVQIDLDALAAARGLMPPTGVGFDLINTGPFTLSASVDLIDADAGPVLGVTQAFEFKPTLMTTIRFSRPLQIGGLQGLQDSWTGEWSDLPQFAIDGTTTFSPTFWLDGVLSTDIGLDLGLVGTMDLLKLGATASVGGVDVLNFSSLSLNDLLEIDSTLFETPKVSFSVYGDTFDLEGFGAIAGQSFTIAVPEPSTYAMLLLGLGVLGATARRRARERRDSVNTPQR